MLIFEVLEEFVLYFNFKVKIERLILMLRASSCGLLFWPNGYFVESKWKKHPKISLNKHLANLQNLQFCYSNSVFGQKHCSWATELFNNFSSLTFNPLCPSNPVHGPTTHFLRCNRRQQERKQPWAVDTYTQLCLSSDRYTSQRGEFSSSGEKKFF